MHHDQTVARGAILSAVTSRFHRDQAEKQHLAYLPVIASSLEITLLCIFPLIFTYEAVPSGVSHANSVIIFSNIYIVVVFFNGRIFALSKVITVIF